MWDSERKHNPRAVAEGCMILERVVTKWGQCLAAVWQSVGGEVVGTTFPGLRKGWQEAGAVCVWGGGGVAAAAG